MRRIWITLLAVSAAVVIALPAGAVKPPKPPTSVPIAVSIEAQPMWVHEGADLLRYTVTLENKTSTKITNVTVEFQAARETDSEPVAEVPANGTVELGEFSRLVSAFPEADTCAVGDECPLVATATVEVSGVVATQAEISTPFMPEDSCGFTFDANNDFTSNSVPVNGVCIWTLPEDDGVLKTGVWKITLDPTPPRNPKRPTNASVTIRDGVPGNWCPVVIGLPSGISEPWTVGDDLPTGRTYLPGTENMPTLAEGMCINGGAGGDYFEVGNPESFYLAADGFVTVKWIKKTPESPEPTPLR